MEIDVQVINAFSIDGKGGNPAGVVFNADNLTNTDKQAIATAAGFAETAFVSSSAVADFKLDFFTPTKQIPHCGHATIATFSYLKQTGRIPADQSSKETIDGTRNIFFKDGQAFMEQKSPVISKPENLNDVLESLNITAADLKPGLEPAIVYTGNSFLIIPVANEEVLASIRYDEAAVSRISEEHGLIGYYLYASQVNSTFDATTRMFAPFYGIPEESATGMAAGPLAGFLYTMEKPGQLYWQIEQGRYMHPASPSLIRVELEPGNDQISRLYAGGQAFISGEKKVTI